MRWVGALVPLAMTFTVAIAGAIHAVAVGGLYREADEGTAAHLFQILTPLQLPIIAVFAATQLPRHPAWATTMLAIQIGALVAMVATVVALGL